jgi:hypothetical protein
VHKIALEVAIDTAECAQAFRFFWAKRVTGFDSSTHCAECLSGPRLSAVNKDLARGGRAIIQAPAGSLIYICGVASPRNWSNNFHLALRVVEREQTVSQLYTGACVTVTNAVAIPIADAAARRMYPHLPEEFLTCRNFQFGAQEFGRPDNDFQPSNDSGFFCPGEA